MKTVAAGLYIIFLIVTGCSKHKHSETPATILSVRYACGTGCDAAAFVVQPSGDSTLLLPANLPPAYKVHNLPVVVDFTRTGEFPEQHNGPDAEIIRINNIYQ